MVVVRAAQVTDRLSVARVHVRSWQGGYRGLIADEHLDAMKAEDRASRYTFGEGDETFRRTVVAIEGEDVVGFASFGASCEVDNPTEGELSALYVEPDSWGSGVGRTLLASAREGLRAMSFASAYLWVLEGNERATRFYGIDGWTSEGLCRADMVWGVAIREIRFARSLV
jgi:GNAT superfamily N-acetyltransferase